MTTATQTTPSTSYTAPSGIAPDLAALLEASTILRDCQYAIARSPLPVWAIVAHATDYINKQIKTALGADVAIASN